MAVLVEIYNAVHRHMKVDMDAAVVDTDCLLAAVGYKAGSGSIGPPCCHGLRCSVDDANDRSVEI